MCNSHKWCTNHSEEKYLDWHNKIKDKISVCFPDLEIQVNNYENSNFFYLYKESGISKSCFPRLGSFEVHLNEFQLFSKLSKKHWPNINNLISKITYLLSTDLKHSRTLRTTSATQSSKLIIQSLNLKIPFSKPLLQKCLSDRKLPRDQPSQLIRPSYSNRMHPNNSKSRKSLKLKKDSLSNNTINNYSSHCSVTTKSSLASPDFIGKKNKPNNKNFRNFEIKLKLNQEVGKKFKVFNESDEDKQVKVFSSDPLVVSVINEELTIPANSSEYIKLLCLPSEKIGLKKVMIVLKSQGVTFFGYNLDLEYINHE